MVQLSACLPDDLNYDQNGGVEATDSEAQADCEMRVQDTLSGLAGACGYSSECICTAWVPKLHYASECKSSCAEEPLAPDCSNFDPKAGNVLATNAPGDAPVCTSSGPMAARLFGQRSACEVSGAATVIVPDEDTKTPAASGLVEFTTSGCPGPNCAVGMSYDFGMDSIKYEHLFGSARFDDLGALGQTAPGLEALIGETGAGSFAPNAASFSAGGRRDGGDRQVLDGANDDAIHVTVNFTPGAAQCTLEGALVGSVDPEAKRCEDAGQSTANAVCATDTDCALDDDEENPCSGGVCNCLPVPDSDMTLALNVEGPIVNQPPTANAGPDQTVECTSSAGAVVTLDGLQSSDPDDNFASYRWFRGSRVGPTEGFAPRITVEQTLGAPVSYVFRVIDTFAQADEDTTQVQVVDSTPPEISCNAPRVTPPGTPVSFTATATDACDNDVITTLTGFSCHRLANGKEVDKTKPCDVTLNGPTLTLGHSLGVGNHVVWTATAKDDAGNQSTVTCELEIARP